MPTPQVRTLKARSERGHASSKDFATAAQSSQKCAQTQPRPRVGVEWVGPKEERESVISPSATEDGQQYTREWRRERSTGGVGSRQSVCVYEALHDTRDGRGSTGSTG